MCNFISIKQIGNRNSIFSEHCKKEDGGSLTITNDAVEEKSHYFSAAYVYSDKDEFTVTIKSGEKILWQQPYPNGGYQVAPRCLIKGEAGENMSINISDSDAKCYGGLYTEAYRI